VQLQRRAGPSLKACDQCRGNWIWPYCCPLGVDNRAAVGERADADAANVVGGRDEGSDCDDDNASGRGLGSGGPIRLPMGCPAGADGAIWLVIRRPPPT
jgi:hypothetical protein